MATQWAQAVRGQIALIILVIFHCREGKVCVTGIVLGSHGSAATISAPRFNFGYWPESHCSPAFPNLGGIPPPGNIVYKKRHQAQQLMKTTPTLPDYPTMLCPLAWQYLLCDPLTFPFHPSGNICTSSHWYSVWAPWIMPPGSLPEGDLQTQGNLCGL